MSHQPISSVGGLLSLDDPDCEEAALVGNKAATLATLRRSGFEVPPGVVVSADALGGFADELPAAVRSILAHVPGVLGTGPWAVRSSGTAEDSAHASYAGQFATFLDIDTDHLAEAVFRCWRSVLTDRVEVYVGEAGPGSMAVLLQPMIPADVAGVAFTADPVTGQARTVIEAVEGLGERLVSGEVTPERWTVEAGGSINVPPGARTLVTQQARAIDELARRVAAHLGRPQDVEWAIADGSLWLLQARPITTLLGTEPEMIPIPIEVPSGYWERDDFHEPVPISPFGKVLLTEQILNVFPDMFAEFGILLDRAEVAVIGGWLYRREIPLGAPPPNGGPQRTPPRWLLAILMRLQPAIRGRVRAARDVIAADLPITVIRRWFDEWQPEHQEDMARALALDLGSLSDAELVAQLDHRLEIIGHPAHVMVAIAYWILVFELAVLCRELLEWETAKMLSLLEGLSTTSTDPARELADLARLARSKPATRALIADVDETTLKRLRDVDAEFAQAFAQYVERNGHRTLLYDVIEPTLAETSHLLLRLVADQLEVEFSPEQRDDEAEGRRRQTTDEACRLLASHPTEDRERFEQTLARAREAYPALEDRVWWTFSVQAALLRYLALEVGRRLVEREQLGATEDVFFLEEPDARAALLDGVDRSETARKARGQRAWAKAHPGPYAYGTPPAGEPPFDLLPPPARLVNQAAMWGFTQLFGERRSPRDETLIAGTAASSGRYSGRVRVIMGEHEFGKIRGGDVVVCPVTSAAWSVVFPNMGALVTDVGGILSHPAIIAREYGIPAVVGTGNATTLLHDDQWVIVDGDSGFIAIVEREDGVGGID